LTGLVGYCAKAVAATPSARVARTARILFMVTSSGV
jgi:hypothetical protein